MDSNKPKSFRHATIFTLLTSVLAAAVSAAAQDRSNAVISGRVLDDSTKAPVVNANVFVANSMIGTSTDTSGSFILKNVPPGLYELVGSCVGYTISSSRIRVTPEGLSSLEIRLRPNVIGLGVVEIVAPRDNVWRENVKEVEKLLLGSTPEAADCQIVNPEILDISTDRGNALQARSDKVLLIDNLALGYRLYVSLGTLRLNDRWLSTAYKTRFEELKPSSSGQKREWEKKRSAAYSGSLRHFLAALAKGELAKQGFAAYLSDTRRIRSTAQLFELNEDQIAAPSGAGEWKLKFQGFLIVDYLREQVDAGFANAYSSSALRTRPKRSILSLEKDSVLFDAHGQILTPFALDISGDWAKEGLARELPLEFSR